MLSCMRLRKLLHCCFASRIFSMQRRIKHCTSSRRELKVTGMSGSMQKVQPNKKPIHRDALKK